MEKAKQKAWQAYDSNNPAKSPYMETDYCNGFEDGWRAHEKESKQHLYDRAYTAAMNALIQTEKNCSPEHIAKRAVAMARALVNETYKQSNTNP